MDFRHTIGHTVRSALNWGMNGLFKSETIRGKIRNTINDKAGSSLIDEIREIRFDRDAHSLHASVMFKGEKETIQLVVADCRIGAEGEDLIIDFSAVSLSREWLSSLLTMNVLPQLAPGNRIRIPVGRSVVRMICRGL